VLLTVYVNELLGIDTTSRQRKAIRRIEITEGSNVEATDFIVWRPL
jgi:hypothetical protein